ncbi:hypothetical protein WISP_43904 [Willisornis vidua]|uniref:Uncharacterized protein n=1 Tax=Willisornis vidua TaxID=1566151 RepID=A0ABQ9DLP9_9PASS|nr:hypothetical protein WISP_43904 [Willisornis vidua]
MLEQKPVEKGAAEVLLLADPHPSVPALPGEGQELGMREWSILMAQNADSSGLEYGIGKNTDWVRAGIWNGRKHGLESGVQEYQDRFGLGFIMGENPEWMRIQKGNKLE